MRKILLTLIAFTTLCTMNVWGDTWISGGTTVTYDSNTLTVSKSEDGDGQMADYSLSSPGWYNYSVTTLDIKEGVTYIGERAFNGLSSMTTVTIPSTVTAIGANAFGSCTSVSRVNASTPNDWASIDFRGTYNRYASPFAASSASIRQFYFYGKNSAATEIAFSAGLTEIKKYAFYHATGITNVYIPGTVTSIGDYALDCSLERVYINKSVAPTTGKTAISWKTSGTYLYLRSDATDSYDAQPWYNSSSGTTGAKNIGNNDYSTTRVNCSWKSGYLHKKSGTIGSINWTLAENGTLTLNGTGTMPSTYNTTYNNENVLPWFRLRQLVNKVVIKGGIEDIGNALDKCWAIEEVSIEQNTIPSGTFGVYVNFKKSTDKVNVYVKANASSISDAKNNAPWNASKKNIGLNETAEFSDGDNTTLLSALKTLNLPFNLQLNRTLTNAQYNTFCSPIALTAAQLNDADIRALESSSLDGNELTLNFSSSSLSAIEAGKPYLIRPSSAVSNPTFTNIDPSSLVSSPINTTTTHVDFKGVLAPTELEGGNEDILFLGADNELFWPAVGSENKIKGMRAYFELKDAARNAVKARITMNPNHTTDIEDVQNDKVQSTKVLRNGQIYLMYEGQMYDVHGRRIQ